MRQDRRSSRHGMPATRKNVFPPLTPRDVLTGLPRFGAGKSALDEAWGGQPPKSDVVLGEIRIAITL